MKKVTLLTTLVTALFVLTACGSGGAPASSDASGSNSPSGFRSSFGNSPLNPESKLALGTIKLEGTKLAVDPKMAANLIPLWQLLFQLNSSSSTAPQEVTAVVDQIQSTMNPDKIKTIKSMQITQADIFTVFQQQAQANGSGGSAVSGGHGSSIANGGTRGNRGAGGGFVFVGGGPGGPGGCGGLP